MEQWPAQIHVYCFKILELKDKNQNTIKEKVSNEARFYVSTYVKGHRFRYLCQKSSSEMHALPLRSANGRGSLSKTHFYCWLTSDLCDRTTRISDGKRQKLRTTWLSKRSHSCMIKLWFQQELEFPRIC